jgi:hypothetical protein
MTRDTWAQLPAEPKHKMGALTTYELRNYRNELEQALQDVPEDSPDHVLLEQRLAAVTAEQDSRQRPVGHHLRGAAAHGAGSPSEPLPPASLLDNREQRYLLRRGPELPRLTLQDSGAGSDPRPPERPPRAWCLGRTRGPGQS